MGSWRVLFHGPGSKSSSFASCGDSPAKQRITCFCGTCPRRGCVFRATTKRATAGPSGVRESSKRKSTTDFPENATFSFAFLANASRIKSWFCLQMPCAKRDNHEPSHPLDHPSRSGRRADDDVHARRCRILWPRCGVLRSGPGMLPAPTTSATGDGCVVREGSCHLLHLQCFSLCARVLRRDSPHPG